MQQTPVVLLTLACTVPLVPAATSQPTATADDRGLRLTADTVSCELDQQGEMRVTSAGLTYVLRGLQARRDRLAIVPAEGLLRSEVIESGPGQLSGRAVFGFPEGVELRVDLTVRAGVPAVLLRSAMERLGDAEHDRDRWTWYHWAFSHQADEFLTGDHGEPVARPLGTGGTVPFEGWAYIPRRDGAGGLGLLSRYRLSSDATTAFIWSDARTLDVALAPAASQEAASGAFESLGGSDAMPRRARTCGLAPVRLTGIGILCRLRSDARGCAGP